MQFVAQTYKIPYSICCIFVQHNETGKNAIFAKSSFKISEEIAKKSFVKRFETL